MSSPPSNPYQRWLGVSAAQPTPWQLLHLQPNERNPEVIRQAAAAARAKLAALPQSDLAVRKQLRTDIDRAEQELLGSAPAANRTASSPGSSMPLDPMAPFVPGLAGPTASPSKSSVSPTPRPEPSPPSADAPPAAATPEPAQSPTTPLADLPPSGTPSVARKARRQQRRQRSSLTIVVCIGALTLVVVGVGWSLFHEKLFSLRGAAGQSESDRESPETKRPPRDRPPKEASPAVRPPSPVPGPSPENRPRPTDDPPKDAANDATNRPDAEKPPAVTSDKPTPSRPAPVPPPSPKEPTWSADRWAELARVYREARRALSRGDFDGADRQVAAIRSMKPPAEVADLLERLKLVTAYARQFRQRFAQAYGKLETGAELNVMTKDGEKICAVVEAAPEQLIIKVDGQIRRIDPRRIMPAMALTIAHRAMDVNDPVTRVVDAAYLATREDPADREIELARQWWREARMAGVDIGPLEEFFGDLDRLEKMAGTSHR